MNEREFSQIYYKYTGNSHGWYFRCVVSGFGWWMDDNDWGQHSKVTYCSKPLSFFISLSHYTQKSIIRSAESRGVIKCYHHLYFQLTWLVYHMSCRRGILSGQNLPFGWVSITNGRVCVHLPYAFRCISSL